jgi:hypothetical protein
VRILRRPRPLAGRPDFASHRCALPVRPGLPAAVEDRPVSWEDGNQTEIANEEAS